MAEISRGAFMSRACLRRLERLQQQLETARRYQLPAALPLPFPEFAEWATALSAELCAAAGMHRDNARLHPLELDLRGLHDVFTNARWYFVRNHGREPSLEEWVSLMEAAEESCPLADSEEAQQWRRIWCGIHGRIWHQRASKAGIR